jgi:Asp-tRNA(Asn)/Glu-tRNA(Gln) amidotransferase A subunit family amidase
MDGAALGVGSDVGGSIRIPSGYCGIFGFKPGHGRVAFTGAVGVSFGIWFPKPVSEWLARRLSFVM